MPPMSVELLETRLLHQSNRDAFLSVNEFCDYVQKLRGPADAIRNDPPPKETDTTTPSANFKFCRICKREYLTQHRRTQRLRLLPPRRSHNRPMSHQTTAIGNEQQQRKRPPSQSR